MLVLCGVVLKKGGMGIYVSKNSYGNEKIFERFAKGLVIFL